MIGKCGLSIVNLLTSHVIEGRDLETSQLYLRLYLIVKFKHYGSYPDLNFF